MSVDIAELKCVYTGDKQTCTIYVVLTIVDVDRVELKYVSSALLMLLCLSGTYLSLIISIII